MIMGNYHDGSDGRIRVIIILALEADVIVVQKIAQSFAQLMQMHMLV